jgi:hypothetical protein
MIAQALHCRCGGRVTRREVDVILSKLTVAMRKPLAEHGARRLSPAATTAVFLKPAWPRFGRQ